ncbi:serine/threonine-protein kinase [Nannocystis sp.]|uniref:serine/threonine-protein kinase n=1 Tax=Nannocystis sp. TaxID=1962667 RepID=UPI002427F227|nr:serine/threonine-protein kinase [Nannocystis sp.]MBK9752090.1 serine/threonine protein kinase [Nannocystis sp.]
MGTQQGLSQTAEEHTLEAGTLLAVHFRVLECVGPCSFGTLYVGEHIAMGSRVAVRVLSSQWRTWVRSEDDVDRFRRAVRDPSQTCHPNIAQVFDAGRLPDGRLFMITEFLVGHNLYEEIQQNQYLPVVRACRILRDVGRAVRAAHEMGLVHRDLKSDNVMLIPLPGGDGEAVQVLDFGIAAWAEVEARKTSPGVFVATPEYMAPEQVQGKPATPLFDIYALGVMLFEALVGEPPFGGSNGAFILKSKVSRPAPSLAQKLPGMPRRLVELADDCLQMDPNLRPQSAREFLVRIDEVLRTLQRLSGPAPT